MIGKSKKITGDINDKDPIDRVLILLDGDESLGVKGLRWRLSRVEKFVMVLLAVEIVGAVVALTTTGESGVSSLGSLLQSLIVLVLP